MPERTNSLMLLDSASMYFRAFFGVPQSVQSPDGRPINAVRGFLDFIARMAGEYHPDRLVACMDASWRPAFRVAAIPSYKAHRLSPSGGEEVPPELVVQVPVIEAVLDALGIARVGVEGFEADDVIGTLAAADSGPVDVVTGDRDMFQVIDDERAVRVLYIAKGVNRHERIDNGEVMRRYGVPANLYADLATLRGDPSDGLPGVPGVGDKTAAGLLARWGSLPALLQALDAGDTSVGSRPKLEAARDYLGVAPAVVAVRTDVPIPEVDTAVPREPADASALLELADRYSLESSVNRVLNAFARA